MEQKHMTPTRYNRLSHAGNDNDNGRQCLRQMSRNIILREKIHPSHYVGVGLHLYTMQFPSSFQLFYVFLHLLYRLFWFGVGRQCQCKWLTGKICLWKTYVLMGTLNRVHFLFMLYLAVVIPRLHRAEALSDDARLTSVWRLSVCRA